eukprot:g5367.t1
MERMQGVLRQLEEKQLKHSIETTLTLLTEAVIEAREIVEKTCSAGFISSMLFREEYASALTKISAKIGVALFQIPKTSLQMNVVLGFDIFILVHLVHNVKFEELATMNDRITALNNILESAFHNDRKEPQDLKKIVEELCKKHLMSKEGINTGLEVLKIEAYDAIKNQNVQRVFECNALIEVLSNTLHNATGSQDQSQDQSQKLEDCLRCPISGEIMSDPVLLRETGMTYDRSSIEEWFKRGNDRDPLTNVRVESKELMLNFALRAACLTILEKHENSLSSLNDPSVSEDKNDSHKILVEAQKEIIDVNLNINSQDGDGWTKLHFASKTNSIEAVKDLISHGANVNLQNNYGESPLYIASKTSSIDVAKELIAHGANVDFQNKNGTSPLHTASGNNSIDVAKELIAHGANIDLQNKNGRSPLYIASEKNSIDVAKELIAHGANIDLEEKDGWTPLHIASQTNSIDVAKELIAHGANIDLQQKDGCSPLYIASWNNSIDVAKELIAHGANIDLQQKDGASPLYIASGYNSIDVAKELIAHDANIDLQQKDGASPLYTASGNNSIDVAKELIAHGANIDLQNKNGRSPLYIASWNNSIDVAKELIAHGANINLQDKTGRTPLHIGSAYGQLAIVKILLEHEASKYIRNNSKRTPFGVVCSLLLPESYNQCLKKELKSLLKLKWFLFRPHPGQRLNLNRFTLE